MASRLAAPLEPQPTPAPAAGDGSGAPRPIAAAGAKAEPAAEAESNVLIARKSPILSIETKGPRRIAIGKEAAYEVTIQNSGEVAAEEVVVYVGLPESADISGADASAGTPRMLPRGNNGGNSVGNSGASSSIGSIGNSGNSSSVGGGGNGGTGLIQWNLGRLDAKMREKLVLRLVPRQSQPFDLAVRWDFKPVTSQATIEVQEPKLALHLDGPAEVAFGKKEVFKLKLSNTGNGAAENVLLTLLPLGNGDNHPVSQRIASLGAGEERSLDVELTARETGTLTIQVAVKADAGAHAELAERVLVRRAALQVGAEGPAMQYVNTSAAYRIWLRNSGNTAAKNVKVLAAMPAGAKSLASSDGGRHTADGNQVQWTLPALEPGVERSFLVKCSLGLPGAARLVVRASADDELVAATEAVTRVEAMAELRLQVKEPDGPVPVGEEASYELHIRNRGTKDAQDVEIMGYFSQGIEPVSAEGAPHRLGPGRVVFKPVASLAAGEEIKFTIRARADVAGNHVFRAEVHCKPLGARLVAEQTTHYYQDGQLPQQATRDAAPGDGGPPSREPPRTADRRLPLGVAPQGEPPATPPSTQGGAMPPPSASPQLPPPYQGPFAPR
jgi:hypothetical protein